MKKGLAVIAGLVLLFTMSGCNHPSQSEMEQTLAAFTDALKAYDKEEMAALLTEFPDNSAYVYYDDIFNDDGYVEMYRVLYPGITYAVQSANQNQLVAVFTMPNIQTLYANITALVLQMVLEDAELQNKLAEDDANGSVLVREMMLAYAKQGYEIEQMTQTLTLTFEKEDGQTVLRCDDEVRELITGNFFLSKNSTQAEINSAA